MEAVARIAVLKASNSIECRNCGASIDLTDPGTRAFVDERVGTVNWPSLRTVISKAPNLKVGFAAARATCGVTSAAPLHRR